MTEFVAARLTPDGSVDPSFAGTGITSFALTPAQNDIAQVVAIDAAGDVYLGAATWGNGVVVKLTVAGALDQNFGSGGAFVSPLGSGPGPYNQLSGLVVLPDGRVLGAQTVQLGTSQSFSQFAAFMLTPGGELDTTFDAGGATPGATLIDFGNRASVAAGLGLTAAGDITVAGFGNIPALDQTDPSVALAARLVGEAGMPGSGSPTNPFAALGVDVRTAKADADGNDIPDTIFVTGPGTPIRAAVVSGKDNSTVLVAPFGGGFTGGGFVG